MSHEPRHHHDPDRGPDRDTRTYVIVGVIVIVVVGMIALHLTGVVGPGSH